MPCKQYQRGDVAKLGREIYLKRIKPMIKEEDIGMFVAIDVSSGDYEIDRDVSEALLRLRTRRPESHVTAQRVGYRTPFHFGFIERPSLD